VNPALGPLLTKMHDCDRTGEEDEGRPAGPTASDSADNNSSGSSVAQSKKVRRVWFLKRCFEF